MPSGEIKMHHYFLLTGQHLPKPIQNESVRGQGEWGRDCLLKGVRYQEQQEQGLEPDRLLAGIVNGERQKNMFSLLVSFL